MQNDNGAVRYAVSIDDRQMKNDASAVVNQFQQIGQEAQRQGDNIDKAFSGAAANIGKAFAAIGVASTFTEIVRQTLNVRGEFEKLDVAFEVMLGDIGAAKSLMGDLVKTAATTPFDLQGVANGAKQLLAYGTAAEDVNDTLVRLGNIASGLSIPLNDLVMLYGTTMTQGRLFTQDLRQFMGRGIPLADELAKQFGVTKDKVGELVTQGKVGFPQVQKAIEALTNEGGKFYGLMEKQSKTVAGQISNIGDALDSMFNAIGESNSEIIGLGLDAVGSMVEHYKELGTILATVAAAYGSYKASLMLIVAYNEMMASQEAAIETQRQASLATLLEETAAVETESVAEEANAASKTTAATAIDAKIVAMQEELAASVATAEANLATAETEASLAASKVGRATMTLQLAQASTAAAEQELAAIVALGDGEAIEAAENKLNTRALEEQTAARALATAQEEAQAAQENVLTATKAKETAATKLSTFNTQADTIAKTANASATGLLTAVTGGLTKALDALKLAWATNPLGIVLIAITTLVGALTLFSSKTEEATNATQRFNDAISGDVNKLNNYKVALDNCTKGTKAHSDAVSGMISLGKQYNVTIESENGTIKDMKKSYEDLTAAIKAHAAEKLLVEAASKADQDALNAEKGAMDDLIEAASNAQYSNGYAQQSKNIQNITTATWSMISQDVMSKSKQMADAFAQGQAQGEAAVAAEVKLIEDMLKDLGVTDKEIKGFHDHIKTYVETSAKGFHTAQSELGRTTSQLKGLSKATQTLAQTTTTSTDLAAMGYDKLKEEQSKCEQQINSINAKEIKTKADLTQLERLKDLLVEIKGLLPDQVTVGSDAELQKRLQDLQTERNSKVYGSSEWNELNDQIKKVDALLKSHKKNYGESQNSAAANQSKKDAKQAAKDREKELEESHKWREQQRKAAAENARLVRQAEIDAMAEGAEKRLAQMQFDHQNQLDEINEEARELYEAKVEHEKELWDNDSKRNKGRGFFSTHKRDEKTGLVEGVAPLTEDELQGIYAKLSSENSKYQKQVSDWTAAENQALNGYLKEYGTYQQQKLAIAQEYAKKIADAQSAGERLQLMQEQKNAEAEVNSKAANNTNWENLFSDLQSHSVEYLEMVRDKIQEQLSNGDLKPTDAQTLTDKLDEVMSTLAEKTNTGLAHLNSFASKMKILEEQASRDAQRVEQARSKVDEKNNALNTARQNVANLVGGKAEDASVAKLNQYVAQFPSQAQAIETACFNLQQAEKESSDATLALESATQKMNSSADKLKNAGKSGDNGLGGLGSLMGGGEGMGQALAVTGTIIHGVNDNVQSFSEAANYIWGKNSDTAQSIAKFAESSQYATEGFDKFKNGDFIGAAVSVGQAVSSLGDSLGLWSNSNAAEMQARNDELIASNSVLTAALNNLSKKISEGSAVDSTKAFELATQSLETQMKNQGQILANKAWTYDGHHSTDYYMNKNGGNNTIAEVLNYINAHSATGNTYSGLGLAGMFQSVDARDLATLYDTEEGIALMDKLIERINDASGSSEITGIADEFLSYIETYGSEAFEELENQWREHVTGISFDSFKDNFKSALMDMDKSASDFADDFSEKLTESLISAQIEQLYSDEIQKLYSKWTSALQDDNMLSQDEIDELVNWQDDLSERMLATRDYLASLTGYDGTSSQSASSGTWKSMSEDTGQELNGRFTALQTTSIQIWEQMKANATLSAEHFSVVSEMNNLVFVCSEYLERIANNSDYLPAMDRKLERIRIHVEKL